ncbi:MAG: helix-turn-helix domain-containing protein [Phormidesmis sp.]
MKQRLSENENRFAHGAITIDFTKSVEVTRILPSGPLRSSRSGQWRGVHLGYYQHPAHEIPEVVSNQHLVLVHLENPTNAEQKIGTQFKCDQFQVGDIVIVPARTPHHARWDAENRYLLLSIDPTVLLSSGANSAALGGHNLKLLPHFATADPLVHGIGLALKSELESSDSEDTRYADTLTTTLFTHLLRRYTAQNAVVKKQQMTPRAAAEVSPFRGLPAYRLRQVIDYIDAHLEHNLTLNDLAAVAQLSPNYFTQLFKQSTGLTPHQYLIQQRVERAKRLLQDGKLSIAEIALTAGFSHQSHLNRHFKRWVGMTPKAFLRHQ